MSLIQSKLCARRFAKTWKSEPARESDHRLRAELMRKLLEAIHSKCRKVWSIIKRNHRLESVVRDMIGRGIDPRSQEMNWEGAREELKDQAEEDVRGSMLLERIAEEEKIDVTDEEIEAEIDAIATGLATVERASAWRLDKGWGRT